MATHLPCKEKIRGEINKMIKEEKVQEFLEEVKADVKKAYCWIDGEIYVKKDWVIEFIDKKAKEKFGEKLTKW